MTTKVALIYLDAGSGHRAATMALADSIAHQLRSWTVELVDLQRLLDRHDPLLRCAGIRMLDIYNRVVRRGWTLGTRQLLPALHGLIRFYHRETVARLRERWAADRPDIVVSLIPHFNRAIGESVRAHSPGVPFVTILTDLADSPPRFWIERDSQYVICGTDRAVRQALDLGLSTENVFRASGMLLNRRFYPAEAHDVRAERLRIGLDPCTPTGLLMFGGEGSAAMVEVVRRLDASESELQLIALCGRDARTARTIREMPLRKQVHVEEFTTDVPRYLAMADFFIGKPGPGALSEALQFGLPVIVERNAWTMVQERYNVEWVLEHGVGISVRSFSRIADAVQQMLEPATLEGFRARARAMRNRAVFEVPGFLDQIVQGGRLVS